MADFGLVQSKFAPTFNTVSYDAVPRQGSLLVAAVEADSNGLATGDQLRITSAGWIPGAQSPTDPYIRMFYKFAGGGEPRAVTSAGYAYQATVTLLEYTAPGRAPAVAEGARYCGVVEFADSPTVATKPNGKGLIIGFAATYTGFSNPVYRQLVNDSAAGVVLRSPAAQRPGYAVWDLIAAKTVASYKATFDAGSSANEGNYTAAIMAFVLPIGGPFWM